MKLSAKVWLGAVQGRAPHGARGLKFNKLNKLANSEQSRPARGAWIEI